MAKIQHTASQQLLGEVSQLRTATPQRRARRSLLADMALPKGATPPVRRAFGSWRALHSGACHLVRVPAAALTRTLSL